MTILLDTESTGGIGIVAAGALVIILAVVAFIAFKILRKTMKMAFRMAIVIVILLIAVAGTVSFWWLGSGKTNSRPRTTQQR